MLIVYKYFIASIFSTKLPGELGIGLMNIGVKISFVVLLVVFLTEFLRKKELLTTSTFFYQLLLVINCFFTLGTASVFVSLLMNPDQKPYQFYLLPFEFLFWVVWISIHVVISKKLKSSGTQYILLWGMLAIFVFTWIVNSLDLYSLRESIWLKDVIL